MKKELEELFYQGAGYQPLVLTEHWQMAQLNYAPEQSLVEVNMFDRHTFTDETFTLIKGRGILITYDEEQMFLTPMIWGCTYNVPEMMWHNIIMDEECIVLITEGRDAHLKGCDHIPIPETVREEMIQKVHVLWSENCH